jgi:hypothetical protein
MNYLIQIDKRKKGKKATTPIDPPSLVNTNPLHRLPRSCRASVWKHQQQPASLPALASFTGYVSARMDIISDIKIDKRKKRKESNNTNRSSLPRQYQSTSPSTTKLPSFRLEASTAASIPCGVF